jgi:ATP-dependent DNA helicase RecG
MSPAAIPDARELIEQLNTLDEHARLEVKRGSNIDRSFLETVCAFANEPELGGGTVILGLARDPASLLPYYDVVGVPDPDQLSQTIATQCANAFNLPLRPRVHTVEVNEKPLIIIEVPELSRSEKPLYLKNLGLPRGAFRRIGSTDHHCTDDDLVVFYGDKETATYDDHLLEGAEPEDLDPDAIDHYRRLRGNVNPAAEELTWSDEDLLQSLSAIKRDTVTRQWRPTLSGILLFGTRPAQRRLLPMMRVDYIRVPGTEWVPDPAARFTTIDMRGPLLQIVQRAQDAVVEDLPKAFALEEGKVQAEPGRINARVFREAIVNALMHRNYRIHGPVQIIRYANRIEIANPGFSIVDEERLGEPGSRTRNPHLAAVFHDTNLAETKGSGIRTMRRLMSEAGFAPPTFESSRRDDSFTARFLLHHFLDEADLRWLSRFDAHDLNQAQKRSLIFVRESGAIDNSVHRQLNAEETLLASAELRKMRDKGLLTMKDKGAATYYVPGPELIPQLPRESERQSTMGGADGLAGAGGAQPRDPAAQIKEALAQINDAPGQIHEALAQINDALPQDLRGRLAAVGRKAPGDDMKALILDLCRQHPFSVEMLAALLQRKNVSNLYNQHVKPLFDAGKLAHIHPDMPRHPRQAYRTAEDA